MTTGYTKNCTSSFTNAAGLTRFSFNYVYSTSRCASVEQKGTVYLQHSAVVAFWQLAVNYLVPQRFATGRFAYMMNSAATPTHRDEVKTQLMVQSLHTLTGCLISSCCSGCAIQRINLLKQASLPVKIAVEVLGEVSFLAEVIAHTSSNVSMKWCYEVKLRSLGRA